MFLQLTEMRTIHVHYELLCTDLQGAISRRILVSNVQCDTEQKNNQLLGRETLLSQQKYQRLSLINIHHSLTSKTVFTFPFSSHGLIQFQLSPLIHKYPSILQCLCSIWYDSLILVIFLAFSVMSLSVSC